MEQPTSTSPLLAYVASDEDESHIVFARNLMEARRLGDDLPIQRAPELDEYAAAGKVPAEDLLEKFGWRFECYHCSAKLDRDREVCNEETGDLREDLDYVYVGNYVYCCPACVLKEAAEIANRKTTSDALRAGAIARFPGIATKLTCPL